MIALLSWDDSSIRKLLEFSESFVLRWLTKTREEEFTALTRELKSGRGCSSSQLPTCDVESCSLTLSHQHHTTTTTFPHSLLLPRTSSLICIQLHHIASHLTHRGSVTLFLPRGFLCHPGFVLIFCRSSVERLDCLLRLCAVLSGCETPAVRFGSEVTEFALVLILVLGRCVFWVRKCWRWEAARWERHRIGGTVDRRASFLWGLRGWGNERREKGICGLWEEWSDEFVAALRVERGEMENGAQNGGLGPRSVVAQEMIAVDLSSPPHSPPAQPPTLPFVQRWVT